MQKTIRIGIVGAGANARKRHLPGFLAIDGVRVVRVCNRSVESARRVAEDFGIPSYTDNWREVTGADDVDAVLIGTWPYLHCPVTIDSLQNGKHVLCEARMAMDAAEARSMLQAARSVPHLTTMLVPAGLTLGVDSTIRRMIADGYLGRLISIDVRSTATEFPDAQSSLTWREMREWSGHNTLNLGIWYESLMRWVGTARNVFALGRRIGSPRKDAGVDLTPGEALPDDIAVLADMECGAQLRMRLSSVARYTSGNEVLIIGTEGTLRLADGDLSGMRKGQTTLRPLPVPPAARGFWRVEEEFIGTIRGTDRVRHTTFEDGVKYMEFTDAVWRSMDTGQLVRCPVNDSPA